jgi:hypothetical protein
MQIRKDMVGPFCLTVIQVMPDSIFLLHTKRYITQTFKENLVGNINTNIFSTRASVIPLV